MAGSRDFKVKNGLIVGDSATIKGPLVVEGNLTVSGSSSITGSYAGFDSDFNAKSTTDLSEGSNLYYTTTRVDSDFDARLATKNTANLSEGTNLYYTTARADSDAKNAIDVTDAGGDGSLAYDNDTGIITYTGPSASEVRAHFSQGTGVTITDGEIAIGQPVGIGDSVNFGSIRGDSFSVGEIAFRTSFHDSHIPFEEGAVWYDPHHKNLNYYTDFDHPIEIGMQVIERVYNDNAYVINKGQPLYYSGNRTDEDGQESPTVALANATESTKYNVQGLAAEDIPINSYGQIVVAGVIDGFDTSSLTAGLNFFAGLTDGAVQNAPPTYPNYPMCLGWVIKSDATNGKVIINQQNHSVNSFRVQGDTHISADLRIDGDLFVSGTQTITSTENVQIGGNIQYLNAGNTIGEANTGFVGTGLDDAFYAGHYSGDSSTKNFFVKIDATGTPDTFEWGFDSSVGTEATGVSITGAEQLLAAGISIDFGATTGHTVGDKWTGTATATNVDTGLFSNKNEGDAGNGYTHVGVYWDASENEWTFVGQYDSEPESPINRSHASFQYGDVRAKTVTATTFAGALSGNAATATEATNVTATANNNTNETAYITFIDGVSGTQGIETDNGLTYNPAYGKLTTTNLIADSATFSGNVTAATFSGDGSSITNVDAQTLDGVNSTSFLRSDVADTKNIGNLTFKDNVKSVFGTTAGTQLEIYHNGTNSIISAGSSSNDIIITNNGNDKDIRLRTDNGSGNVTDYIKADGSTGEVILYHYGSQKFKTTDSGATVTGSLIADSATISGNVTVGGAFKSVSTDGLTEGAENLYYTTTRADSDFDVRLATKSTDNLTEGSTNQYFSNSLARGAISVTDAGGDGSLGYVEGTGVITYTGPSASETRAHFSAGSNIAISSGEISTIDSMSIAHLTLTQTTGSGVAPLTVSSTVLVSNLNADLLDGQHGSHYRIDVYDASGTLLN